MTSGCFGYILIHFILLSVSFSYYQILVTVVGFPLLGDHSLKEESPFSPSRTKYGHHSHKLMILDY